MSEIKRVKIQSIVESQIPEFLNDDSPLFREFLEQYYISQEHQTGVVDLAVNLQQYKSIDNFNAETFYSTVGICTLTEDITSFDDVIVVNHTIGFPQKYGLLKIDNEIITYTGITTNSFTGCIRGFSGMDQNSNNEFFTFSTTDSAFHTKSGIVTNLNLLFFNEIFKKFKIQFLPGFEDRQFINGLNLKNILSRAKDFYISKGTDTSYKILFQILFGKDIQVIKPQDYLLRPSDNNYLVTKNILVEQIVRDETYRVSDFDLRKQLKGKTIFEILKNGKTASAAVYNIEYRPVDDRDLYEISLDSTSFIFNFESTKKTNISEYVVKNSTSIIVDSTVGFKKSGSLLIKTSNLTNPITLTYTDKTLTEFLGVSGVIADLNFGEELVEENFLYSYLDDGTKVEFRLINIIDNIDYSQTSSLRVGDKIQLSEFGTDLNDRKEFNFWNYNIPTTHKIKSISGNRLYFYDKLTFINGDKFNLLNPDDENDTVLLATVNDYGSNINGYYVDIQEQNLNISTKTQIKKIIKKASSYLNYFPSIINLPTGVQNTYVDYNFDNFYVTSSGLPNNTIYATDRKIKVAKTTNPNWIDNIGITSVLNCVNHNFYTGEKIYYVPSSNSGIKTSIYFLTKYDDNNIKLSYSNTDLYTKNYINFSGVGSTDYFVKLDYQNKTLKHQKLFKKFNLSKKDQFFDDPEKRETVNKKIGILADGVELFSTTIFQDNIYYGKLDSVFVNVAGQGYDVINFSGITVEDNSGSGAIVNGCLTGHLDSVKVLSPGIGYQTKPKITLTGGNGSGAILESNLVKTKISSNFKATSIYNNSIIFSENHNFDNFEEVFYNNNLNTSISPLVDGSSYFVGVTSTTQINLYNTKNDSISGINTISISGIGYSGIHSLTTVNSKNTITKIYVKNGGSGYSNRFVSIPSLLSADNQSNGINTFDDYIFAKNHNFKNEDLVLYTTSSTAISGLSTQINYHVTVIDENKFKLSIAGVSANISRENYINKKYVSFDSVGVGTHKFSYPPIEINVESISGITTTIIEPSLDPIVLGSFDNVFIENNGSNYGTPDIINFHRKPLVSVRKQTSEALLKPVIVNGSIVDVQILNAGNGYTNDIDIIVTSESGKYADLHPIVVNGKITQILVINSGINYDKKNTKLDIKKRGLDARFIGNIFAWKINQIEKNKALINSEDEGVIIPNDNIDFELQFVNYYPSKKLRKNLNNFVSNSGNENPPQGSINPYQILGWAYDGNPIFGPYGKVDGKIQRLKSSYIKIEESEKNNLINSKIRPNFNSGFFIQDFYYDKSKSNGNLDQYNGMFIKNSDFPNINYGYFFSIDDEGNPQYPYLIGSQFKDFPITENFEPLFNQEINFNGLDIVRNTGPYYLNSAYASYDLINKVESKYKQEFAIKQIQSSGINSVSIYDPGQDYKPGDNIIFDDFISGGTGLSAAISRVKGKKISNIQIGVSTFSGVTFITNGTRVKGITGVPHNLITNDEILVTSISSSPYNYIQGFKKVLVNQKSVSLLNDIPNQSITGVTTYINVNDISGFEVDNLIKIDTETLRVIDISFSESKLFVNRYENYTGIHTAGIVSVVLLPNTFTFDSRQYDDTIIENKTTYFNPSNTIGIGTSGTNYYKLVGVRTDFGTFNAGITSYIGINTATLQIGDYVSGTNVSAGTTIVNIGIGSIQILPNHTLGGGISTNVVSIQRSVYDKFVPSRSIYIPNHKYYTGQSLTYNVGLDGTGIIVSNTGTGSTFRINQNQTVYAVNLGNDYVGLSTLGFTTTAGIGTTNNSLYFQLPITNIGLAHSLTTQYSKLTGTFENYSVTVSTAQTHGLQTDDKIKFNVFPSFSNTIKLRYDTTLRKITTDKIDFDASSVGVNTQTNEINITNNKLKTGDKVVYYTNGNTTIGGLTNNNTYYILKQDPNKIKLSKYLYDTTVGTCISFTSVGVSTHSIALINPPISLTKGDVLTFDLTDSTVSDMDLRLYKDPNFIKEIESFKYIENIGIITNRQLNTQTTDIPNELYYNLIPLKSSSTELLQISCDKEVVGNNRIKIVPSTFNNEYPIIGIGSTSFKFNLNTKPENTLYTTSSGVSTIFYDTNSTNASGPISKIKINFGGKRYIKLPKISSVETISGKNAILRSSSSTIGKVIELERVKDGFNYPTDVTLTPFLSSPAIVQIKNIARIDYVGITTGGKGYNTAPSLKVIGNDKIKLSAELQSGSIVGVKVVENTNDLITPLRIIPINNSNGYEIDNIVATNDGSTVTLELLNDTQLYPLITTGYGKTETIFPFSIGDEIFIEKCRQQDKTKDNFNSKDYGYRFFIVTGISSENFSVSFSMTGVKDTLNLNQNNGEGNYINSYGYGSVINKKDMPEFEMILIDDLSYISGEKVTGIDNSGNSVFSATVMENGWDNDINQLRLIDAKGELEVGNKLKGEKSLLNGTVEFANKFNLKSTLGVTRDKVNDAGNEVGFLNNYQQRISDNYYYQKFSYAIKSEVFYDVWKEPVHSIIHPAGFKEFSDLDIISKANKNLKVGIANSTLDLLINLDNALTFYSKNNFSLVTEDAESLFEDGSIERVNIGAEEANVAGVGITGPIFGLALKPYTLSKTNKVLLIDDISSQFNGSNEYVSIATTTATFDSFYPYYINVNTENLSVGDYVGFSTLLIPDNTVITEIGIGSVRLNLPHKLNHGIEISNVKIRRRLPGNSIVGINSFNLTSNNTPLFYRQFNSSNSNIVNIDSDIFNLTNHNFQTGQKILYSSLITNVPSVGAANTSVENTFTYNVNKKFDDTLWNSFDMTTVTFDSN